MGQARFVAGWSRRESSVQLAGSEEPKLDPERPSGLREATLIEDRVVGKVRNRNKRIHVRKGGPALEGEESPELKLEAVGSSQPVHRGRIRVQAELGSHEPIPAGQLEIPRGGRSHTEPSDNTRLVFGPGFDTANLFNLPGLFGA